MKFLFAVLMVFIAGSAFAGEMRILSPAFVTGGGIPPGYSCDGGDISPELVWRGAPPKTKALALIMDDPDAPDPAAPRMIWTHWVLYNIPPATQGLTENVKSLPDGTVMGINSWGKTGYGGPCPPIGRHRYFFRLYALDSTITAPQPLDEKSLMQAMQGHIIESAELVGKYRRMGH